MASPIPRGLKPEFPSGVPIVPIIPIVVIGSGFGGLGMAIRLKQEGMEDFIVLERAEGLGGTWRDNTYPGCACDVESHLYSFSFAPNPGWTRSFSAQPEIRRYLEDCADRFGLRPHLRFGREVREARWEEGAGCWRIATSKETFRARVLIGAMGAFSEPRLPEIPGIERFEGKVMHSSRWDHSHDLTGREVAVIGTGASAIQFVPAIQPSVARLRLFQRTPPWVMRRYDRAFSPRELSLAKRFPALARLRRAGIFAYRELLGAAFRHPWMMPALERLATRHLESSIQDPALRAKLKPSYRIGCKRILISNDYYPALARPNVDVVTDPIREIRGRSVVTGDGTEHPADTLILGTGFHVADMPLSRRVRGRRGRLLADAFDGSPRAYLGMSFPGFPNLFLLLGPNTGLGHTSVVLMIESQIEHAIHAIRHMREREIRELEPKVEAEARFVAEVDRRTEGTVWVEGGCSSWYLDATGRNSTLWPGSVPAFGRRVRPFRERDYETRGGGRALASRGLKERAERRVAKLLFKLPHGMQRRLARGGAVTIDGDTLHPELQLILSVRRARGMRGIYDLPTEQARQKIRRDALIHADPSLRVGSVRDFEIEGPGGPLKLRHYAPPGGPDEPAPLLVFLHGGGFAIGDLDTHDSPCRFFCRHAGIHVLAVDYRLAPEHRFPAGLDDCRAAFAWAREHAASLGADPSRVALGGDSSGGNFAAVITRLEMEAGAEPPSLQLLIYPTVHRDKDEFASLSSFADGFFLTRGDIERFREHYVVDGMLPDDYRHSPMLAKDHSGQPHAIVVTAGFDPLRDEGDAYARVLREAGTPVTHLRMKGMVHGFINMFEVSPACLEAMEGLAAALRTGIRAAT